MEKPEIQAWDRIIVVRITQVQEAQQLFIDEEKPEEAMILARSAVQGKDEIRRVAHSCEHMPWCRNRQDDCRPTEGTETFPSGSAEESARGIEVNQTRGYWKQHTDQALQQKPQSQAEGQQECPRTRMRFAFVKCAQKGPHGQGDGEGQHYIRNEDTRKKKQADASRHA